MPKVCLVTIDGKFSRSDAYHKALDLESLMDHIKRLGHEVSTLEVDELASIDLSTYDSNTFFAFGGHLNPEVNKYYEDVAYFMYSSGAKLLPSLDMILSYENKGLQGLLSRKLGIDYLSQTYHYKAYDDAVYQKWPIVYKTVSGAGSSGVRLVSSNEKIRHLYLCASILSVPVGRILPILKYRIGSFFDKFIAGAQSRNNQIKPHHRFVLQEFSEGLSFDYKVLIFFDIVYVLKRKVRPDDFRASGSGDFAFVDVDEELLEFSYDVLRKSASPYLSLDIIWANEKYSIIEYQALHFGPYTQINAPFFYKRISEGRWERIRKIISLESCYAYAISNFVED